MPIQPNSRTWTLRLKHHTTTILLHVDPLQSLSGLKAELLIALQQTHPDGTFNGRKIVPNPDDLELARPVDHNDLSQGWESLENLGDEFESGKGKGKAAVNGTSGAAAKKGRPSTALAKDTVQAAGLRDGEAIAFAFKSTAESAAEARMKGSATGKGVNEDWEMVAAVEANERQDWDVIVPTMEETYGDHLERKMQEDEGLG